MAKSVTRDPPLRPYQAETIRRMQAYEGRAALLVLATGLGKTRIFTEFLRREVLESDHHCLILSHRAELVRQPLTYLPDLPCGVELAEQRAHGESIISASVQSLIGRLGKYNRREVDTIIVDEAHHAAAPTYRKILDYFCSAQVFGFTATAHRGDEIGLACVFEDLLVEYDTLWGIRQGYLTSMECLQTRLKYRMGAVKITDAGDFDQKEIARVMSGTAAGVVETYTAHARGQTIIFAASVDEARDICTLINERTGRKTAGLILSTTQRRDRLLEAYRLGALKVLVNYGVLTEGTDLPSTETVLIARPIAHTNVGLYAQMAGRALRLFPGKEKALIIDCVGISDYPICTAATLIGKPVPDSTPQKEALSAPREQSQAPLEILQGSEIPRTWIKEQKEVNIMNKGKSLDLHGVAWIKLKSGEYLLPIPNMVYRISAPNAQGNVYLRKNKQCSKTALPPQVVLDDVYLDLQKNHSHNTHIWDSAKRHVWDGQPATRAQRDLIAKLSADCDTGDIKAITRGDASDLIQMLLYAKEGS